LRDGKPNAPPPPAPFAKDRGHRQLNECIFACFIWQPG
jgi:hypothetical protein